jgi:hypothetical protein
MELIIVVSAIVSALGGLGLLAARFGFDSRDTIDQDPGRTTTPRFV